MAQIKDDGERMIPAYHSGMLVYAEHISRYRFAAQFVAGKRVLDIASGTGYGSELLKQAGATSVIGVDCSKDAVAYSLAEHCGGHPDFVLGDAVRLPLGDRSFDVIVSFETLEHVPEPDEMLAELRRVLKEDGLIVASTPNKSVYPDGNPFHLHELTYEEFLESLNASFKHVQLLSQDSWVATALFDAETMTAKGIRLNGSTDLYKTVPREPQESVYMIALASNALLPKVSLQLTLITPTEVEGHMRAVAEARAEIARRDAEAKEQAVRAAALADRVAALDADLSSVSAALDESDELLAGVEAQLRLTRQQLQAATGSVGFRLLERVRRPINWLAPPNTRRRVPLKLLSQALRIILNEGWFVFLKRAATVWRWAPRLVRSPGPARESDSSNGQYQKWLEAHALTSAGLRRARNEAAELAYRPTVSIVMPAYNSDPVWLRQAIESVRAQLYESWELCIADDGSTRPGVRELLQEYDSADERIKVAYLEKNQGIGTASNAALAMANGEFVGFLDHDDELKPEALFEVVKLLNERTGLDFIYSDEDKLDESGNLVSPFFKPDWSPDLLMTMNYINHFSVIRKALVDRVGGFRPDYDGSQDYDLVLRVTELTERVAHIAKPLYSWRMVAGSAASVPEAKEFAFTAAKKALTDALARRGLPGEVSDGLVKSTYRTRYAIKGKPRVSIIIPTRDRLDMLSRCVQTIRKKSSYENYEILVVDNESRERETLEYLASFQGRVIPYPHAFNFASIVNAGARAAEGEVLLFLNNDTEVISPDWIEAMLEHAQRPQVAAVGARLLYPDGRIQHEGIIMGLGGGSAGNVDHRGYFSQGQSVRNCSAVTGACMMVRADVFWELCGFDERLRVAFNDVDYCLRAREKGLLVIYTPYAVLYHHESASRGRLHPDEDESFFRERWGKPGQYRDPYYNPNLSKTQPFTIEV
jgi:GT2 family glycosyltransferase/2-polyprenyl-3-methyl-5-hydroxy-6-metoxy-1,4-benzoquinol methylase